MSYMTQIPITLFNLLSPQPDDLGVVITLLSVSLLKSSETRDSETDAALLCSVACILVCTLNLMFKEWQAVP